MIALRFAVAAGLLSLAHGANAQTSVVSMPEVFSTPTETFRLSDIGAADANYSIAEFSGNRQRDMKAVDFQSAQPGNPSRFTLSGTTTPGEISAVCKNSGRVAEISYPEFKPQPGAFRCAFTVDGQPMHAQFEMQENAEPIANHGSRMAQRGEINMDGTVLQIRSVHKMKDTVKRSAVPLGYLFEIDGKPVGGVALGDVKQVILPTAEAGELREIVLTGVLALSLMWHTSAM